MTESYAEVRKHLDGLELWLPEPRFKTLLRRERKRPYASTEKDAFHFDGHRVRLHGGRA